MLLAVAQSRRVSGVISGGIVRCDPKTHHDQKPFCQGEDAEAEGRSYLQTSDNNRMLSHATGPGASNYEHGS